ncbi:MAG: 50S ribosomal protein P1 [Halobacteriota archaeon]
MEYLYAALVLHNAGQDVTEDGVTEVLEAAGVEVDESRVKALVAALEDVDIDEAVEQAAAAPAAPAAAPAEAGDAGETDEEDEEAEAEEEEDDEEAEEDAAEGLGELFG